MINRSLYDAVAEKARNVQVKTVCLGLGYTAVIISDGSPGMSYTYFNRNMGCTLVNDYRDFEGGPALELLSLLGSKDTIERSMALALVNALIHSSLHHLPPDKDNSLLFDTLGIRPSTRVAMVGLFRPLVKLLESSGVKVEVIDEFRKLGDKQRFYEKLDGWADAALITSTSILNNSFEEIMEHVPPRVHAALLGPSTPMLAAAFSAWPSIKALAGTVVLDVDAVLKVVRHGLGTPYLHRHSKKVTLTI